MRRCLRSKIILPALVLAAILLAGPKVFAVTTDIVSVNSIGDLGNNTSQKPSLSLHGRYVVFISSADNLVENDLNEATDAFVLDRETGALEIVSLNSAGEQHDGYTESIADYDCNLSSRKSISSDGRFVVFYSNATNIVPGAGRTEADPNKQDVFVRDRLLGTTEIVSVNSDGVTISDFSNSRPSISADGRYVAFESYADNLVTENVTGQSRQIYVHDRVNGTTELVSKNNGGETANGGCDWPSLSNDGRLVVFVSSADNLVENDMNGLRDVFVCDRETGMIEMVTVNTAGDPGNGGAHKHPSISGNGRYVAFMSYASDLVEDDFNGQADVFVRDLSNDTTEIISVHSDDEFGNRGVQGNGYSRRSNITDDGRFVVFVSDSDNLVDEDTAGATNMFVRDRLLGETKLVSISNEGSAANALVEWPDISPDGSTACFSSSADNLVDGGGDTNGVSDVFIRVWNNVPEVNAGGAREVDVYETLTIDVTAADPDNDSLTLSAIGLPAGAVFTSDGDTGVFTWTPGGAQGGDFTVTFTATDNGTPSLTGKAEIVISVIVTSPIALIDQLILEDLAAGLPNEVENSHLANLLNCKTFLENGKVTPAVNQLEAFIHKVEQDIDHGKIDAVLGEMFIQMANAIKDKLDG